MKRTPTPSRWGLAVAGFGALSIVGAVAAVAAVVAADSGAGIPALPRGRAYYPADPAARARIELEEGNLSRALEFFEQAFAPDRPSPSRETRLAYARALTRAGRIAKAQSLLAELIKSDPRDAAAISAMADLLEASGDVDQALLYAQRAAHLRPKDAYLWKRVAQLQLRANRPIEALASAERSLELDPDQEDLKKLVSHLASQPPSIDGLPGLSAPGARRPGAGTIPQIPDPRSLIPDPSSAIPGRSPRPGAAGLAGPGSVPGKSPY
jgi:tetratricopeptide (TPR) repeat protein